ncbi:MAG: peptide ABC transporter permease [Planctomycetes bacterium]|nr:peptide ABC transporter permease [Planctomycetota bacterium]
MSNAAPTRGASKSDSPGRLAWRAFRHRRSARLATAVLVVVGGLALLAPLLPLAAPSAVHLDAKLRGPTFTAIEGAAFDAAEIKDPGRLTGWLLSARVAVFGSWELPPLFGTDALGRCLLSRILWGARLSLMVGLVASIISLIIGVGWGAVAGYAGGRTDAVLMRAVDVLYALPLMFIVIFVVALLRGFRNAHPELDVNPSLVLFAVIGATSWLTMARIVRGQVTSLRSAAFIDAARACGARPTTILWRHVLPNVSPVVLVTLTLTVPRVMLFEAFLSFLGLGVEAPDVSWGVLARQGFDALTAVHASLWLIAFPGLAFALTLLAMNVVGDALRDALDPRLRGERS